MARKPTAAEAASPSRAKAAIVSSAHLVSPRSTEMSEFEFGLIVANNAFHRWIVHCMSAAGLKDLTEGQRITFEVEPDKKGKGPKAVNLVIS